jgi:hypothetical protein
MHRIIYTVSEKKSSGLNRKKFKRKKLKISYLGQQSKLVCRPLLQPDTRLNTTNSFNRQAITLGNLYTRSSRVDYSLNSPGFDPSIWVADEAVWNKYIRKNRKNTLFSFSTMQI